MKLCLLFLLSVGFISTTYGYSEKHTVKISDVGAHMESSMDTKELALRAPNAQCEKVTKTETKTSIKMFNAWHAVQN